MTGKHHKVEVSSTTKSEASMTWKLRSYYSIFYLWSAEHHARLAQDIEDVFVPGGASRPESTRHRVMVMSAVTDAVAFAEAAVNEIGQDIADGHEMYISKLSPEAGQRITGYWLGANEASILDKYDSLLHLTTGSHLNRGVEPTQSMVSLIKVRNFLVHYKPADVGSEDPPHKYELALKSKFAGNRLIADSGNAWWPDHALGAGLASWAAKSARAFVDAWLAEIECNLPYQTVRAEEAP